ncbi:LysE family translocator [Rhodanobacter aciditrophus]|uniref:LysE family translocator n=2 Tax=Bacteria TaxID=2 RepID=A0ABW4B132_9GAMM
MLEILLFSLSIMYTPGPVNLLTLLAGVKGEGWRTLQFCLGVGVAMCLLFLLIGYLGEAIVSPHLQRVVGLLGGLYLLYLAVKILRSRPSPKVNQEEGSKLTFLSGLIMQLSNPKALIVILPVVTIQFPNAHIVGPSIALWSILLSSLAAGAPTTYWLLGSRFKTAALSGNRILWINRLMGVMLGYIALQFIFDSVVM